MQCIRDHLDPGGRLVFDVFNPNLALLAAEINSEESEDTPELSLRTDTASAGHTASC